MTTYGTYQRFKYQTVNLDPIKKLAVSLVKLFFIALLFVSAVVVAVAVFQLIVIASNILVAWFAVHGWQVGLTVAVFVGAWRVKP